ncbi:DUF192 domain-containing protein [Natronomonas sp.]|uniref:DUF192 domain-containing protein n=1 Tax=Natronomonas sp. TaxID=2184060 RepID=UPI00262FF8C0|nr:DUF192 domain-containing protein [Natronomonas sp.]
MRRRRLLAAAGCCVGLSAAGCTGDGPTADAESADRDDAESPQEPTEGSDEGGAEDASEEDLAPAWPSGSYAGYDTTRVSVETAEGEALGTLEAAVARTPDEKYLGLSDAESLPENAGMLFVYAASDRRSFVMRRMDFGIDIVYADGDGVISTIHHAPAPGPEEDGNDQVYPGEGRYVLEVPYDWTTDRGVTTGDVLALEV